MPERKRRSIARPFSRARAWFDLEWVFPDDLYMQAFSEITPDVFLGRRPTVDDVDELMSAGITHVVSCLPERLRPEMQFLNGPFEHRYLAARDEMDEDIGPAIAEFIEVVEAARGSTAEPKILVHCEVGVSRSASLAIACLMDDNDISMFDAFDQVRSKRAQVLPNIGFASALQEFEFTMHPERRAAKTSLARYLKEACSVPAQIDEIEDALRQNDFDAPSALRAIYGEIPRVVQGTRTR